MHRMLLALLLLMVYAALRAAASFAGIAGLVGGTVVFALAFRPTPVGILLALVVFVACGLVGYAIQVGLRRVADDPEGCYATLREYRLRLERDRLQHRRPRMAGIGDATRRWPDDRTAGRR